MDDPRPEKVAVVSEVRDRIEGSEALVVTEYRGLDVAEMAELRTALRAAGGDIKVYKNTLMRLAADELDLELHDLLTGPTALAFVSERADGTAGDPVTVAKALDDFSSSHDALVIKGGLLDKAPLTEADVRALAKIAPREVLLAQLAGLMAAPMAKFAALLNAVPQNMAYALKALIEAGGASDAPAAEATPAEGDEASDDDAAEAAQASTDDASTDAADEDSNDQDSKEES